VSGKITYFISAVRSQTREESASPEGEPILLAPFAPKQYSRLQVNRVQLR